MPALPHLCFNVKFSTSALVCVGVREISHKRGTKKRYIPNKTISSLALSNSFCSLLTNSSKADTAFMISPFPKLFNDNDDYDDDSFDKNDGTDDGSSSGCYLLRTYYMHNFLIS